MSAKRRKKKSALSGGAAEKAVPPAGAPPEAPDDSSGAAPPAAPAGEIPDLEALRKKAGERDEFLDRLQRTSADFANYQKRMQRELEETRKYAAGPVVLDLLGVVDNLHRAIGAAEDQLEEGFIEGFRMIERQFLDLLKRHGVQPIEALNQPFDPNVHDALMEAEDASLPDKTVIDELEKGYMLHDRLLRPSRVRVSRRPRAEVPDPEPKPSEAASDGGELEPQEEE